MYSSRCVIFLSLLPELWIICNFLPKIAGCRETTADLDAAGCIVPPPCISAISVVTINTIRRCHLSAITAAVFRRKKSQMELQKTSALSCLHGCFSKAHYQFILLGFHLMSRTTRNISIPGRKRLGKIKHGNNRR